MALGGLFGGGSGGGSTWKPYKKAEPYAQDIMGEAQDQYNTWSPTLPDFSITAGMNPYQTGGYGMTAQRAMMGSPLLDQGQQTMGGISGGGYLQNPYGGFLMGAAGQPNPATPYSYMDMLYGQNANAASQYLLPTARGDYLNPEANPQLQAYGDAGARQISKTFRESTSPTLDAYFENLGPGGIGSPAYARGASNIRDDLGQTLNEFYTGLYHNEYQNAAQNQLGASQALGGFNNQDYMNRLSGTGQFGDMYNLGLSGNLQAAGMGLGDYRSGVDQMMTSSGMTPMMSEADYTDPEKLAAAGDPFQQQQQRELDEASARYDYYYGTGPGGPAGNLDRYSQYIQPYFGGGMQPQGNNSSLWGNLAGAGSLLTGIGSIMAA